MLPNAHSLLMPAMPLMADVTRPSRAILPLADCCLPYPTADADTRQTLLILLMPDAHVFFFHYRAMRYSERH